MVHCVASFEGEKFRNTALIYYYQNQGNCCILSQVSHKLFSSAAPEVLKSLEECECQLELSLRCGSLLGSSGLVFPSCCLCVSYLQFLSLLACMVSMAQLSFFFPEVWS